MADKEFPTKVVVAVAAGGLALGAGGMWALIHRRAIQRLEDPTAPLLDIDTAPETPPSNNEDDN